ncbi:MAG: dienelactone hydrolase family protein [Betaproteobacteria bacterium]|nr:dienelactone hydrolase family protein [Betaproteobacteria bacterium]
MSLLSIAPRLAAGRPRLLCAREHPAGNTEKINELENPMTSTSRSGAAVCVDGQNMALYVAHPEGAGPFPGLVVIQHASGVDEFVRAMADQLAEAGYVAAAPDLYHRQAEPRAPLERMAQLKDAEVIADVNATVEALRADRRVQHEHIGVVGFCMGGRIAYMMAACNRHLKAAVVYYGGNTMRPWGEGIPSPFERTEDIGCPVLFHCGEEDTNPSPADCARLEAELSRLGKPHEFFAYPRAGHAFMNFMNAERYRETAAKVSWLRTLEFLSRHLRSRSAHIA